jgi:hypothetical protein
VLSYGFSRALLIVIAKLFQVLVVKISVHISKWRGDHLTKFESKIFFPLLLCQIISIILSYFVFLVSYCVGRNFEFTAMLSLIGIVYINIIMLWYFDRLKIAFEYKSRIAVVELELKLQSKYLETQVLHQKETDALWHDMKKHIALMKRLISSAQSDITSEYVHMLEMQMGETRKIVRTNYPVLSALLTEQVQRAQKSNIHLDVDIKLVSKIKITPIELCTILGNLFDNAFEALSNLPPDIERRIKISIFQRNSAILINIENPFTHKYPAKPRAGKHGLGLDNIRYVVNKYCGYLNIEEKDQIFKVTVLIP